LNSSATRSVRGAISFRSSIHLPPISGSTKVKPVRLPLGCARLVAKPLPIGSETTTNTIGMVLVSLASALVTGRGLGEDDVRLQVDQLLGELADLIDIAVAPAQLDAEVAAFAPAQPRQGLAELRHQPLRGPAALEAHQHADHPDAVGLRAHHPGPGGCGHPGSERAALHRWAIPGRRTASWWPSPS
jgi:hypothetical protein